jgi:hypothetical protein
VHPQRRRDRPGQYDRRVDVQRLVQPFHEHSLRYVDGVSGSARRQPRNRLGAGTGDDRAERPRRGLVNIQLLASRGKR